MILSRALPPSILKGVALLVLGYLCYSIASPQGETTLMTLLNTEEKNEDLTEEDNDDATYPKLPVQKEYSPRITQCPDLSEFVEENKRRVDWVSSQCDNTVRSKISEIREMFYFPKSYLGWCPVYKSCSSNVFSHFCADYFETETCQDKRIKMHGYEGGFRDQAQFNEFHYRHHQPEDEKRFLVVRDPFTRLLSHYRNKVELFSHTNTLYKDIWADFMVHYRPMQWIGEIDRRRSHARAALDYAKSMTVVQEPDSESGGRKKRNANKKELYSLMDYAKGKTGVKKSSQSMSGIKPKADNPYLNPPYPTFKEVVSGVTAGWSDNHIIPASQRCGPCGETQYDFLLKAESFDCDINNMFRFTDNERLTTNSQRWSTNQTPPLNMTMFYSYYSTLSDDQLDNIFNLYQDDCLLFQYPCQEHIKNIKKFKLLNPDYKHEYRNTWNGRVGDWEIIS